MAFDLPARNASRSDAGGPSKSDLKTPRFHADIVLQSHDHPAHNAGQDIPKEREFFFIDGPGEYEIKGVRVHGLKTFHDSSSGKKYGLNTVYSVEMEDINLCFLGDFGEKELRSELKEKLGKIDVLFVPIGGETVLDPEEARNFISQIEPAIAIPMHYSFSRKKDILKEFLAEMGQKDVKPLEKLSLKKKDVAENGTQVIVLISNF